MDSERVIGVSAQKVGVLEYVVVQKVSILSEELRGKNGIRGTAQLDVGFGETQSELTQRVIARDLDWSRAGEVSD